ncbi:general transcription factor 3C polypeptide 1 isoform X2 [Takifugu rubripes]|uniref:general transcription factor 3C polypeptide 1 isoform X2 n=1 Tax=Takifugu rubripes TaxID=31033 RepID=UPI001145B3AD|nr:general transcription factor 3C polypeptide 1 isoform X2 [Takifugu rubripes]
MDGLSITANEVALEGLDGITLPSLWLRLENRQPKFPLKLDEPTKELLWRSLTSDPDLKFYQNPEERDDIVLFDRFGDIDPETGIEIKQSFNERVKDVYPIHIVENRDGIQGSCAFFTQRTDVTKHVRSKSFTPLLSLQEVMERYGRKLVVVASPKMRFRALIGSESDPDLKLTDDSYCVLERVGRARWQGELQKDLHGHSFKIDARKLHYLRISLVKHGLVTMQSHCTRVKTGQQQHSILLLLKRFHINRRSKYDILMEYVSNFLQRSPGQVASIITLKAQLNVTDSSLKRVIQYMRSAKLIEIQQYPLEDLDPSAGPCVYKKGHKVLVRCLKLLKPYSKKGVTEVYIEEDEDDDEDYTEMGRALPPEGRIMEQDLLSQAYQIVLSCGSKGIPQSSIGFRMNIGKLESRMICRRLERDGMIKGFMEDEGRQRTTKFISHKCAGVSNQLQLFVKEQERNKLLCSADPQVSSTPPSTPAASSTSESANAKTPASRRKQKAGKRGQTKDLEEEPLMGMVEAADEHLDEGEKSGRKSRAKQNTTGRGNIEESPAENSDAQPAADCSKYAPPAPHPAEQHPVKEEKERSSCPTGTAPQSDPGNNNIVEVTSKATKAEKSSERSHETYRLLRRKNLIVEAVRNFKIIEGLFQLQKMINDEEKQGGFNSKCCKKTILRLVHSLSREGLLKFYCTTVIQDGITKKVELVVHPSIQPNDEIVTRAIEQIRFKISSSHTAARLQIAEENTREQLSGKTSASKFKSKVDKRRLSGQQEEEFKPVHVRGLGKKMGFLPKMPRLRVIHTFIWYLLYGHTQKDNTAAPPVGNQSSPGPTEEPVDKNIESASPDQDMTSAPMYDNAESASPGQDLPSTPVDNNAESASPGQDLPSTPVDNNAESASPGQDLPSTPVDNSAESASPDQDVSSSPGADVKALKEESKSSSAESDLKVYVDEDSWKRFVPFVRVLKDYGSGWAMVGDLLLCLPLSIFVQFTQINYKVDDLEEYLNDPVKQHYLIRSLPARMKRQLLYKRKYIFAFHENLQKLVYMGLLHFAPTEKFKEKDQAIIYLKRKTSIVDTTSSEPHYWLVTECPDKPFEHRQYTFNSAEDVENYWFDLMCVCLNTPLGVVRNRRNVTEEEVDPSFVHDRTVFVGLAHLLKGSREVCDDGSLPGDGRGAGGLDSEFFGHLKRNWFWTNHLLASKTRQSALEARENKIRLNSLLSKNALRFALRAGGSAGPRYVTAKRPLLTERIELDIEPASRNQQVVGGKGQKRKRTKKEAVKAPRKKRKEPKKRMPAHDEADHRALKMMTRQRVNWSVQEDSLMMLCRVASHLLNSKLKRPFIPYCVVRDLLHSEFEMSLDKTSVAAGRRTRYILKNPQTLLNYRISLAEVYQDKPLMKLLEEKKPANPENGEDCAEVFAEYVRLLRQKFSTAPSLSDTIVPDTKHQLCECYTVLAIQSGGQIPSRDIITCREDIHTIVLNNLIQSTLAMNNNQMKSSRSFQTFQLYSKYNQELLCKVFLECRRRGLVNRRRVNQSFGPKKNRALPILPMSYQLSQFYYRSFSTRFPHSLFTDSFRFLKTLRNSKTDDRKLTIEFYNETLNRLENVEETTGMTKESGKSKKQNVSSEDDGARDGPEMKESTVEEEKEKGEEKNPEGRLTSDSAEVLLATESGDDRLPKAASEEAPDVSDMMVFSLDSPGGVCMTSLTLISLGMLNVHISIPKHIVVVDSNLVDNDTVKSMAALDDDEDDDDDENEEGERKQMVVKAHQASHTKYLMIRGYCNPGIVKRRDLHTVDSIVVESCIIRLQLRNTPAHHLLPREDALLDLNKCGPDMLPPSLTFTYPSPPSSALECESRLIQRGYTPQDVEACARLQRNLDAAGEAGLDLRDLCKTHAPLEDPRSGRTRNLLQYMKDLREEGQVVQVGCLAMRWVLTHHADPWLLTLQTKWATALPTRDEPKTQSNVRKRSRRDALRETECPAKRSTVDAGEAEHATKPPGEAAEKRTHEEELGDEEGKDGGKLMNVEAGQQVQPEDIAGEKKIEAEEEQEKSEPAVRDEEEHLLTAASSDVDDEKIWSFVSRPWRMVDSNLNRPVCKGMLEGVLCHIMSRPGITHHTLVEHYKTALQPMALLDLVEALIDMDCVVKKTLVKSAKPSLFSCPASSAEARPGMEELDAVYYEPTLTCSLRLAQVLPYERHWNYCLG